MSDLPFPLDPAFDYILTESDRKKFAPLQVTDEMWLEDRWIKTYNDPSMGFGIAGPYRRRKSYGWVSVDSKPAIAPCWVYYGKAVDEPCYRGPVFMAASAELEVNDTYTHWHPVKLEPPTPPQPPRPAAEVAFEEWASEGRSTISPRATWLAAIEWAKSHKGEI